MANLWSTFRQENRPSRGTYRSYTPADFPQLPADRDIYEGLAYDTIQTLSKPEIDVTSGESIRPKDVAYLGSYNWVDESHPTIIVPGETFNSLSP